MLFMRSRINVGHTMQVGRERGKKKNGKRKEDKKGVHPKGMKDKNDVYDYINQGEVL